MTSTTAQSTLTASCAFDPEPNAPWAARQFVTELLQSWGREPQLVEDATLVCSELATNAVLHARSRFSVTARASEEGVHLSVQDSSLAPPVLRPPARLALSGYGLHLVAAVANAWGVEAADGGKAVWAELR